MLDAMAQLVTRIDAELVAAVDDMVATGVVRSRSDAVRIGLTRLVDDERRRRIGQAIVDGYRRVPQGDDPWVDALTRETVEAEPW
jgi:Arc/MetJ-type ribon-helix-helix transcriptional regulator